MINKKLWERLTAYSLLIQHGQSTKRHLQDFFVAAGTCYPIRCLATTRGDTDSPLIGHGSHRKRCVQRFCYYVYSLSQGRLIRQPLPSNGRGDTHTDTETDGREPLRWAHIPLYTWKNFLKVGSGTQKLMWRDIHIGQGDLISLVIFFFKMMEVD
jgi:hypothetical protein